MADVPKNHCCFALASHINLRRQAGKRVINPKTGHQYEIGVDEVDFICPICECIQAAPVQQNEEYACPRCNWRYLVIEDVLYLWSPAAVGVTTTPLKPGTRRQNLLESGDDGEEKALVERERARKDWLKARGNTESESFGLRTQSVVPEGYRAGDSSSAVNRTDDHLNLLLRDRNAKPEQPDQVDPEQPKIIVPPGDLRRR